MTAVLLYESPRKTWQSCCHPDAGCSQPENHRSQSQESLTLGVEMIDASTHGEVSFKLYDGSLYTIEYMGGVWVGQGSTFSSWSVTE